MIFRATRSSSAIGPLALTLGLTLQLSVPCAAAAQDTSQVQGVRIGLTYAAGTRPGLYVLPMRGARADSLLVSAMARREIARLEAGRAWIAGTHLQTA